MSLTRQKNHLASIGDSDYNSFEKNTTGKSECI